MLRTSIIVGLAVAAASPTAARPVGEIASSSGPGGTGDDLSPVYHRCLDKANVTGNFAEVRNCLIAEQERVDQTLNAVYRARMAKASRPRQAALRREERAWIVHRDAVCKRAGDAMGGQAQFEEIEGCLLDETAKRVQVLKRG